MAKKTCSKGHIYDIGVYGDDCPFCPSQDNGSKTEIDNDNKTVISPVNTGETYSGKTQISSGMKTKISGRPDPEPVPPTASISDEVTSELKTVIQSTAVEPFLEQEVRQVSMKKRKGKKMWLFVAIPVFVVLLVLSYLMAFANTPLEEDDYRYVLVRTKNNDSAMDIKLTKNKLLKFFKTLKEKYPNDEDLEEYSEYRISLLVNKINSGDYLENFNIYLGGMLQDVGYSGFYGVVLDINDEFYGFEIQYDQEFSDRSGIGRVNTWYRSSSENTLQINKYRYSDTNEPYYSVGNWDESLTKKQKTEALKKFFNRLRYSEVYNDPKFDKEWFKEVYTGIEEYQQMNDLLEIK